MPKRVKLAVVPASHLDEAIRNGMKSFRNLFVTGEVSNFNWDGVTFFNSYFSRLSFSGYNDFRNVTFLKCSFENIFAEPYAVIKASNIKASFCKTNNIVLNKEAKFYGSSVAMFKCILTNFHAPEAYVSLTDSTMDIVGIGKRIQSGQIDLSRTTINNSYISRDNLAKMDEAKAVIMRVRFEPFDRVRVL